MVICNKCETEVEQYKTGKQCINCVRLYKREEARRRNGYYNENKVRKKHKVHTRKRNKKYYKINIEVLEQLIEGNIDKETLIENIKNKIYD